MTTKKWLDDDEQRAWIGLIATMTLLDVALDRQLQRASGLSHAQYAIMARLSESPNRTMHMSELAIMTSSSQSRLSHAVARLEDEGWIIRVRCSGNGRAVHATLTESGYQLVVTAAPGHVSEVRRLLFDHLTHDQVDHLIDVTTTALTVLASEGFDIPRA